MNLSIRIAGNVRWRKSVLYLIKYELEYRIGSPQITSLKGIVNKKIRCSVFEDYWYIVEGRSILK